FHSPNSGTNNVLRGGTTMRGRSTRIIVNLALSIIVALSLANASHKLSAAAKELVVYSDALGDGWEDWSWNTTVNLANRDPVHVGSEETPSSDSTSIAAKFDKPDGGLKLHTNNPVHPDEYDSLYFWIN